MKLHYFSIIWAFAASGQITPLDTRSSRASKQSCMLEGYQKMHCKGLLSSTHWDNENIQRLVCWPSTSLKLKKCWDKEILSAWPRNPKLGSSPASSSLLSIPWEGQEQENCMKPSISWYARHRLCCLFKNRYHYFKEAFHSLFVQLTCVYKTHFTRYSCISPIF